MLFQLGALLFLVNIYCEVRLQELSRHVCLFICIKYNIYICAILADSWPRDMHDAVHQKQVIHIFNR